MKNQQAKKNLALIVAGIVFAIVAIVHLLRLILQFEIIIAGVFIPFWVNVVGFIIAFILSVWMFKASAK